MQPHNCLLYSRNEKLYVETEAYLRERVRLKWFDDRDRFERHLRHAVHAIVILDIQSGDALPVCRELSRTRDDVELIVLGEPQSEAMLEAESLGVYACLPTPVSRSELQALVDRACQRISLEIENRSLREQVQRQQRDIVHPPATPVDTAMRAPTSLGTFSRSLRHIQNLQSLMENIVEGVASSSMVARVGIVACTRDDPSFRFFAGLRCLEEARRQMFDEHHPLVRWLETHACQVARSNLEHIRDYNERLMLKQELDALGAEIILPLQGRTRLLGWLFLGQRGTGIPFSYQDLEQLLLMAEHVSTTLENAFLYEETAIQRSLSETLLQSIPTGIVSVSVEGTIKSINRAAADCLKLDAATTLNRPVSELGSRLADVLLRAIHNEITVKPAEWTEPRSHRRIQVEASRLMDEDSCLGAVCFIHDVTEKRAMEEKQEHLERTSFWHDLAASMSHEIRNPLVAIKTYAQLLPERYEDAEFRTEFSRIVSEEVERLNRIIEQINDFAHPPDLQFKTIEMSQLLQRGIGKALEHETTNSVPIRTILEPDLPSIKGDPKALSQCLANLITNALEATYDQGEPKVELKVHKDSKSDGTQDVVVVVSDNGPGIPTEFQDKIFSPFCTSKPRGMGLGLPIAKRTAIDHNGRINVDSASDGTQVVLSLPARLENGGGV